MSNHIDETNFEDEAWRAVIGPSNQAYYFEQFSRGSVKQWHWPAFFFTWYWLLYRKMWGWALGYFFLPYILFALLGVLVAVIAPQAGGGVISVLYLAYLGAIFFGPPLLANKLYHAHCAKQVRAASTGAISRERALARLEARGGTSNIALILVGIFGGIAVIGILAAVAIPAYQDYTIRAKTNEIHMAGEKVAREVGRAYETTGALPQSLDGIEEADAMPRTVESIEIDPSNGVLTMSLHLPGHEGAKLQLVPELDDNKRVHWRCQTDLPSKLAPKACRD